MLISWEIITNIWWEEEQEVDVKSKRVNKSFICGNYKSFSFFFLSNRNRKKIKMIKQNRVDLLNLISNLRIHERYSNGQNGKRLIGQYIFIAVSKEGRKFLHSSYIYSFWLEITPMLFLLETFSTLVNLNSKLESPNEFNLISFHFQGKEATKRNSLYRMKIVGCQTNNFPSSSLIMSCMYSFFLSYRIVERYYHITQKFKTNHKWLYSIFCVYVYASVFYLNTTIYIRIAMRIYRQTHPVWNCWNE